jgi:iron complex transport system ATP-binding protein
VILLKEGRVAYDGPKREILTDAKLSEVFGAPVRVSVHEGRYFAHA